MPEPVLYIRGMPSESLSSQTVKDLKIVSALSGDVMENVGAVLTNTKDFLSVPALTTHLKKILSESDTVDAVRRVILNIESDKISELIELLQNLATDNDDFPLSSKIIEKLGAKLPQLLKPIPALARFRKAERLSKATGQPLEDIQLICDLRPIFNETRERIEGMFPYTRLKIVATGEDGLPRVFEAELSAQQVADLSEKTKKAEKKLKSLRTQITEWLPDGLPEIPVTRVPEN